ncbi:TadE/TadG family type IV pilus assembly protein [Phycobacter azelaicus]|jgi:Flp pilus assembly protein TadG|uniref:TadE/TadG family type IV pilus assembly protein n=1 Tax=Phycobacter azelaicus TaxID=2668075 RepID=UPI001869107B|nr:pilus assembly protein [Phycobacter azelaicus]MBE1297140.1 pilus assembly protein [Paracoccaceae bacterium]
MFKALRHRLTSFSRDTEGSVSVEFAIYTPLLLGLLAAFYTFFDAFRQESINLKAAYTISDLISRETNYVNNTYLDSMYTMGTLLLRGDTTYDMRVSVVRWDEADQSYYVDWSKVRGGGFTEWTDATIHLVKDDLPSMPDQERVILVETKNTVEPAFRVGLPTMEITNFVFTRPRFAPQVVFVDDTPNGNSHSDNAMGL